MSHPQERNPPLHHHRKKIQQIISHADRAELERHYTFLPSSSSEQRPTATTTTTATTWQDRVVQQYHSHLYKEYVLADLTRPGQVGLRWRIREEVISGKGHQTCGNKHCPSLSQQQQKEEVEDAASTSTATASLCPLLGQHQSPKTKLLLLRKYYGSAMPMTESEENRQLEKLPYGIGLADFEVPFSYVEHGKAKDELVKLRLCLRCAPLLFQKRNGIDPALQARIARDSIRYNNNNNNKHESSSQRSNPLLTTTPANASGEKHSLSSPESDSSDEEQRQRHKKRRKRRSKGEKKRNPVKDSSTMH